MAAQLGSYLCLMCLAGTDVSIYLLEARKDEFTFRRGLSSLARKLQEDGVLDKALPKHWIGFVAC